MNTIKLILNCNGIVPLKNMPNNLKIKKKSVNYLNNIKMKNKERRNQLNVLTNRRL